MERVCSVCKISKELKEFNKDVSEALGRSYDCRLCSRQRDKLYRAANRDKHRESKRRWRTSEKGKRSSKAMKARRRADKLRRTPKWADLNKIRSIYRECPEGHQVDHIVPLKGHNVSGLHVQWNLQYLTKLDNAIKGNKYP